MKSSSLLIVIVAITAVMAATPTAATAAAAPGADEMARCASIAAPDTRLACYDVLAHRPVEKAAPAPAAVLKPAKAPAEAPASAAAIASDPKNFGLTPAQQHLLDVGPKAVAAHISILSSDKLGQTTIVLDSGQTWTVLDDDGRLASGDAVRIKRAMAGSYLMLGPSNHSYRVRRTH